MATWRHTDTASDLSGGTNWSRDLDADASGTTVTNVATGTDSETDLEWTVPNIPNNAAWETGNITVEVEVTAGSMSVSMRPEVARVDSGGTVQEGPYASNEGDTVMDSGSKSWTWTSRSWSAGNAGDRLRVSWIWSNSGHAATNVTHSVGDPEDEVITSISIVGGGLGIPIAMDHYKKMEAA